MKKIQLGGHRKFKDKPIRGYALIDDRDFKKVSQIKWTLHSKGYATGYNKKTDKVVFMHRFILNPPKNKQTDHINDNKLDNRRQNLRVCNNAENHRKQVKYKSHWTSKYRGVYWNKTEKVWVAQIRHKKNISLGRFRTEHQASLVRDLWALDIFKEYARPNNKVVLFGP